MKKYTGFFAKNRLFIAATTLTGTIVGAGILGIPYVIAKTGFFYGSIIIILIGAALLCLNLFMGEVVLRTKTQHQLPGYAEKYLGKTGKRLMAFAMLFTIYGALSAYIMGEGETIKAILGFGSPLLYSVIFFLVAFLIVWKGVKFTGKAELILISFLFLVVVLIGIYSFQDIKMSNLTTFDASKLLIPYGVILFAFLGSPAIPEVQEVLGKEKKKMRKAILLGSLIPIFLYLFFTLIVVGIISVEQFDALEPNQHIATIALSKYAFPTLGIFANLMAILAMFTSFLTLGIALSELYEYDYGLSRKTALLLTFSLPLLVTFFKFTTFIAILGITGAVAGGLEGILITLMYWKAKKHGNRKPEYTFRPLKVLGIILIGMFACGIIYQLWVNFF